MKCQQIIELLEALAPKKLAEEWDNVGLLVGSPADEVTKIMTCLDITQEVVERAIEEGVDMIISHHPLIFKGIKKLRTDLYLGNLLKKLLCHNIVAYAAHTNLDIAEGGVNDTLAALLKLESVEGFIPTDDKGSFLGRIGKLPEAMDRRAYAKFVRETLGADYLRLITGKREQIKKVALCSGAGGEFIDRAAFAGADIYITGDIKYHEAQRGKELGLNIIDAGHFATEMPIAVALAEYLYKELEKRKNPPQIIVDDFSKDPFEMVL